MKDLYIAERDANAMQRKAEAAEKCCIAISGIVDALYSDCFADSLSILLGVDTPVDYKVPREQLERAYKWLFTNYNRISSDVFAALALAETATENISDIVTYIRTEEGRKL